MCITYIATFWTNSSTPSFEIRVQELKTKTIRVLLHGCHYSALVETEDQRTPFHSVILQNKHIATSYIYCMQIYIYIYMFVTCELVMFHYVWSMLKGHKFWQYPAAICRSKTENGVEPALWGKHVPMQAGIYESWRFLTAARSTRHAAATVPTTSLCCDDTGQNHAISFACQLVN